MLFLSMSQYMDAQCKPKDNKYSYIVAYTMPILSECLHMAVQCMPKRPRFRFIAAYTVLTLFKSSNGRSMLSKTA